jgi:hypothetical protein
MRTSVRMVYLGLILIPALVASVLFYVTCTLDRRIR